MRKILIFTISMLFSQLIRSQELAKHNMYQFNLNYSNPAATGISPCKVFSIADKHQWTGIIGAPSLQLANAQLSKQTGKTKKHALGLTLLRDKNGATQNLSGEFLYAFHIQFSNIQKQNLSLGLSANFEQHTFDESNFTPNINDPAIGRGIAREFAFNASSGIYLYKPKYFTGIAVYNLLPTRGQYYQEYGNENFFTTAIAGYNFAPRSKMFILKSSVYACIGASFLQIDLNNHFYLGNNVMLGLTLRKQVGDFYRSGQNALFFFGYDFENWNFSYAYDLEINKLQQNHYGSNQISIGYKICRDKYACPTYNIHK